MMRECWSERPEVRPTFEQLRTRIAAFLDVSSDAYGYIQVSAAEYERIYVSVRPGLSGITQTEEESIEIESSIPVKARNGSISESASSIDLSESGKHEMRPSNQDEEQEGTISKTGSGLLVKNIHKKSISNEEVDDV